LFDSLLRLPDEQSDVAVDMFRIVSKFVHEHTLTDAYQLRLINYLLHRVERRPELRDEATLQAMRMTYENTTNKIAEDRAWLLLGIFVALFTPTKWLFTTLLNYIITEGACARAHACNRRHLWLKRMTDVAPEDLSPLLQRRFWRVRQTGSRTSALTSLELQSLLVRAVGVPGRA
jgi:hypothetical protein